MRFEWDDNKARTNLSKHGISFEIAMRIWDDPNFQIIPDESPLDEERWTAVGNVGLMTIVIAVHTYREREHGQVIRIISARKATSHERKRYEAEAFR